MLGLASKSIHLNFGLTWGPGCNLLFLSADVIITNLYYYIFAVLDALIAISEDLNLKFSWEACPGPPSLLTFTRENITWT